MTIGGVPHTQLDELDPAQRSMENRRIKGQHLRGALRCHPWLEKIPYFSHMSRAFSQRTKPSFMDVQYFPHGFPMIFANGQRGPIQKLELSVIRPPVFIQLCSHGNEPAISSYPLVNIHKTMEHHHFIAG